MIVSKIVNNTVIHKAQNKSNDKKVNELYYTGAAITAIGGFSGEKYADNKFNKELNSLTEKFDKEMQKLYDLLPEQQKIINKKQEFTNKLLENKSETELKKYYIGEIEKLNKSLEEFNNQLIKTSKLNEQINNFVDNKKNFKNILIGSGIGLIISVVLVLINKLSKKNIDKKS